MLGFDEVGKILFNFLGLELQNLVGISSEKTLIINRKARDIINHDEIFSE